MQFGNREARTNVSCDIKQPDFPESAVCQSFRGNAFHFIFDTPETQLERVPYVSYVLRMHILQAGLGTS